MEKVFMGLGILFMVLSATLFIAFVISIICDNFEKKHIAQRRAEAMQRVPMRIVEVSNQDTIRTLRNEKLKIQSLENEVRSLRLQLQSYQKHYFKQLQKEIKKEEPIQGTHCKDCKNNVSSIACKANVKCKLYEQK